MTEIKNIGDLSNKDAPYNPRKVEGTRLAKLEETMREYGDLSGIVFNARTQRLVGGHMRKRVMEPEWSVSKKPFHDKAGTIAIGYVETPHGKFNYREVDWGENKERVANIIANDHTGQWVSEKLFDNIAEIKAEDPKFDESVFSFKLPEANGFTFTADEDDEGDVIVGVKQEHQKLKEARENPDAVDEDEFVVIKFNVAIKDVDLLDNLHKTTSMNSRSHALRHVVQFYREAHNL